MKTRGFTLIELLIGAATLAIAIVALLGAFFGQITLNEHARNMTWAINDANRVMERLRQLNTGSGCTTPTASAAGVNECGGLCPAGPTGWDTWLGLAVNGGKSIQPNPANNELVLVSQTGEADPITITVAVCWRHRGRILGECTATAPGGLQGTQGANGFSSTDGIFSSPAMLTTLMTCRSQQ